MERQRDYETSPFASCHSCQGISMTLHGHLHTHQKELIRTLKEAPCVRLHAPSSLSRQVVDNLLTKEEDKGSVSFQLKDSVSLNCVDITIFDDVCCFIVTLSTRRRISR